MLKVYRINFEKIRLWKIIFFRNYFYVIQKGNFLNFQLSLDSILAEFIYLNYVYNNEKIEEQFCLFESNKKKMKS